MPKLINILKIAAPTILVALAVTYVSAQSSGWTAPTQPPPGGNVPAPINVGSSTQSKLGALRLNTSLTNPATYGLDVFGKSRFFGNVGIGTTNPDTDLEIVKDNADSQIRFHDPNNYWYTMGLDSTSGKFKITSGGLIDDANHFSMDTSGRIGTAGASPECPSGSGWGCGVHTWDVWAESAVRTKMLCLGGETGSNNAGDCRTSWSGGGGTSLPTCAEGQTLKVVSGTWQCAASTKSYFDTTGHIALRPRSGWLDTGLDITLTPSSANSKFVINAQVAIGSSPGSYSGCQIGLFKNDSTTLIAPINNIFLGNLNPGDNLLAYNYSVTYVDQAYDMSTRTYKIKVSGGSYCYVGGTGGSYGDFLTTLDVGGQMSIIETQ